MERRKLAKIYRKFVLPRARAQAHVTMSSLEVSEPKVAAFIWDCKTPRQAHSGGSTNFYALKMEIENIHLHHPFSVHIRLLFLHNIRFSSVTFYGPCRTSSGEYERLTSENYYSGNFLRELFRRSEISHISQLARNTDEE